MSTDARATIAAPTACLLGEGALWCGRSGRLLFTDIEGRRLHAHDPARGTTETWPMPDRVGSLALVEGSASTLLLALAKGVALFDLAEGRLLGDIVPVDADDARLRLNDGRCDPQGRFVVGTYCRDETPAGHWWRIDGRSGRLQVERLPLPEVAVANACSFSPDGRRMVFADSPTRTLWCCDYPADGAPGRPEVFARLADDDGYPDGACVDADGGLWVAVWDGAALLRFDADGRATDRIALPAQRPTCPAFGGPAMDRLYVTSARAGLAAERIAAEPAHGALLQLPPAALGGRRGLPERRFRVG